MILNRGINIGVPRNKRSHQGENVVLAVYLKTIGDGRFTELTSVGSTDPKDPFLILCY